MCALLVELPVFGRPTRLVWRKHRWCCIDCGRCWSDENPEIATAGCALTTQATPWSTMHVGRNERAVTDVARELGCGWHTLMDAVVAIGEQLVDHSDRIGQVTALGLDETLFERLGRYRTQAWSTHIVDVRRGQLLDVVPRRTAPEPCRWLAARSDEWRDQIEWATLDLSASNWTVFDTMLPDAVQLADPMLLLLSSGEWGSFRAGQTLVDVSGDVALETSDRFTFRLTL
jgi:transposase